MNAMPETTERPDFCTEEELDTYLVYLDTLRASGATNMWGAARYLEARFPELAEGSRDYQSAPKARAVLLYWMHTFSERHPA